MQIEYSKFATKFIALQDKTTKQRIKVAIEGLTEIPPKGNIKQLQGYTNKTYRLRIGKYRVVYRYKTNLNGQYTLFICDIDSRGDIYK